MGTRQSYINHIGLVLDASISMDHLEKTVIAVTDDLVSNLSQRSKQLEQETRFTIYTFGPTTECVFYDQGLWLPSIKDIYRANGRSTALIDATMIAIEEMEQTATLHGDHAFLLYVVTDGQENSSKRFNSLNLTLKQRSLPDNWTVAVLVPDQTAKHEAKKFGFAPDNIAVWDATSARGVVEVGNVIRQATDDYMVARSQGVRGSKSVFQLDVNNLTTSVVKSALRKIAPADYRVFDIKRDSSISEFVSWHTGGYRVGTTFYQPTKPVKVQDHKKVVLRDKRTGELFTGDNLRQMLGLPDHEVTVHPTNHPLYDVFIQSTSPNRKLFAGTQVIVFDYVM
jgi:hypothetical protein